jgi:hypothetical protein
MLVKRTQYLLFLIFALVSYLCKAQSYRQDSLQIKSYTLIEYRNNEAKEITLLKVLCDYCSEAQSKAIGNEAVRRSYNDRYNPENRMKDGQKRLAVIIRIAKTDLAAIKE